MTLVRSCVLPGAQHAELESGAYACPTCQARLVRQLAEIESYLDIVSAVPSRSGDFGPHRPGFSSTPPARLDVIAMFDPRTEINGASGADIDDDVLDEVPNIHADLEGWWKVVYEEHPDPRGGPLRTYVGWIATRPWVDEFASDIARVHGALRRACGDAPARPFAHCPEVVNGTPCGGQVAMQSDGLGAQCRNCRASWRRDQLLELMHRVEAVNHI